MLLFLSGCSSLADGRLCSGSNSPDESQQFTSNCSNDLSLGLTGRTQLHIALVQAVLSLPSNLLDLFRNALLPSAQSIPDTLLSATSVKVGNGFRLALPTGAYYTWKGSILEGTPIEPDKLIEFDWRERRRGSDIQLERAADLFEMKLLSKGEPS